MPVLLKDEVDADYVGVWADRVEELERMKLRIVEKEETTLLFEGRAGRNNSSAEEDSEAANANAEETSTDAAALESDTLPEPPADEALHESESSIENEDDSWKQQYMEETKKIKGKLGTTGPATRKFLEEEAARAASRTVDGGGVK
jgi:hypothetical protein